MIASVHIHSQRDVYEKLLLPNLHIFPDQLRARTGGPDHLGTSPSAFFAGPLRGLPFSLPPPTAVDEKHARSPGFVWPPPQKGLFATP